jgi:hypothetical protein
MDILIQILEYSSVIACQDSYIYTNNVSVHGYSHSSIVTNNEYSTFYANDVVIGVITGK